MKLFFCYIVGLAGLLHAAPTVDVPQEYENGMNQILEKADDSEVTDNDAPELIARLSSLINSAANLKALKDDVPAQQNVLAESVVKPVTLLLNTVSGGYAKGNTRKFFVPTLTPFDLREDVLAEFDQIRQSERFWSETEAYLDTVCSRLKTFIKNQKNKAPVVPPTATEVTQETLTTNAAKVVTTVAEPAAARNDFGEKLSIHDEVQPIQIPEADIKQSLSEKPLEETPVESTAVVPQTDESPFTPTENTAVQSPVSTLPVPVNVVVNVVLEHVPAPAAVPVSALTISAPVTVTPAANPVPVSSKVEPVSVSAPPVTEAVPTPVVSPAPTPTIQATDSTYAPTVTSSVPVVPSVAAQPVEGVIIDSSSVQSVVQPTPALELPSSLPSLVPAVEPKSASTPVIGSVPASTSVVEPTVSTPVIDPVSTPVHSAAPTSKLDVVSKPEVKNGINEEISTETVLTSTPAVESVSTTVVPETSVNSEAASTAAAAEVQPSSTIESTEESVGSSSVVLSSPNVKSVPVVSLTSSSVPSSKVSVVDSAFSPSVVPEPVSPSVVVPSVPVVPSVASVDPAAVPVVVPETIPETESVAPIVATKVSSPIVIRPTSRLVAPSAVPVAVKKIAKTVVETPGH